MLTASEIINQGKLNKKVESDNCREALDALIAFYLSSPSRAAESLNVHRRTVYQWIENGKIGKRAAMRIDADKSNPFTLEFLRPDL